MKQKKFFALFFVLALSLFFVLFGKAQVKADTIYTEGDWKYSTDAAGRATIVGYIGSGTTVTIPSSLNGKTVYTIAAYCFQNNSTFTNVTIPGTIKTIQQDAFYGCTALTKVTMSSGVTTIGRLAFAYCPNLSSVTIPSTVTSMDSFIFKECPKLKTVGPGSSYNISIAWTSTIPNYAFHGASYITSFTIPDSITTYGTFCFYGCSGVTSIPIGKNVKSIYLGAFAECTGIKAFTVASGNNSYKTADGVLITKVGDTLVSYPSGKSGASYTTPSGVTVIGDYAFENCINLSSLTISEGVTVMGRNAINDNDLLTHLVLPSSLTSIGYQCIAFNDHLSFVQVPPSVTSIGYNSFTNCATGFRLAVVEGSTAYTYARDNDIPYDLLPKIITNPVNYRGYLKSSATFRVTASSYSSTLTYQWEVNAGSGWYEQTGATSSSYTVVCTEYRNGYQYRCKVSNQYGYVYSEPATVTVVSSPIITSEPDDMTVTAGDKVTLSVTAHGITYTELSYQWQVSKDGGSTFTNVNVAKYPSAQTATLTFNAPRSVNGYEYRVKIINAIGESYSDAITLTVQKAITVTTQPSATTVAAGSNASFTVAATGSNLTYAWQVSKDGGSTWTNVNQTKYPSAKTNTLTFKTSEALNGYYYRCVVSNTYDKTNSSKAELIVTSTGSKPTITSQPSDCIVKPNEDASFTVKATGSNLKYTWQVSKDYGSTWKDVNKTKYPSAATATLKFTASDTVNGYWYRCQVSNSYGSATSSSAVLVVSAKPYLISYSTDQFAQLGETVTFKVVAANATSYQWEYSKNGGTSWTVWTGKTSSTVSVAASKTNNGCLYRCKVSNENGYVYSGAPMMIVTDIAPKIIDQPKAKTVSAGQEATFSVYATGLEFTYQWQVSKDGGKTWKNINQTTYPSAGWSTLTFTTKATMNGYLYRCIVDNGHGTVTSSAVKLTVN